MSWSWHMVWKIEDSSFLSLFRRKIQMLMSISPKKKKQNQIAKSRISQMWSSFSLSDRYLLIHILQQDFQAVQHWNKVSHRASHRTRRQKFPKCATPTLNLESFARRRPKLHAASRWCCWCRDIVPALVVAGSLNSSHEKIVSHKKSGINYASFCNFAHTNAALALKAAAAAAKWTCRGGRGKTAFCSAIQRQLSESY